MLPLIFLVAFTFNVFYNEDSQASQLPISNTSNELELTENSYTSIQHNMQNTKEHTNNAYDMEKNLPILQNIDHTAEEANKQSMDIPAVDHSMDKDYSSINATTYTKPKISFMHNNALPYISTIPQQSSDNQSLKSSTTQHVTVAENSSDSVIKPNENLKNPNNAITIQPNQSQKSQNLVNEKGNLNNSKSTAITNSNETYTTSKSSTNLDSNDKEHSFNVPKQNTDQHSSVLPPMLPPPINLDNLPKHPQQLNAISNNNSILPLENSRSLSPKTNEQKSSVSITNPQPSQKLTVKNNKPVDKEQQSSVTKSSTQSPIKKTNNKSQQTNKPSVKPNISQNQNNKKSLPTKPIAKNKLVNKSAKKKEKKAYPEWTELKQQPLKKWPYNEDLPSSIYKKQYNEPNKHLPMTMSINDYYKQMFYCIIQDDVSGLRALIDKLETLGVDLTSILEKFRTTQVGDNLLIYAVKHNSLNVVRFLLSLGANPNSENFKKENPLSIAIKHKRTDIINAITEMKQHSYKRIHNNAASPVYNWAKQQKGQ